MNALVKTLMAGATAMLLAGGASAQVIGIGTNATSIGTMTAAVSAVVSKHTSIQMRPQTVASTSQYVPMVNGGEIEFGIANAMQTLTSIRGIGMSEGRKNPNLRIVATLVPTLYTPVSRKDSPIKTTKDLKGVRYPSGWTSVRVGHFIMGAYLANAGLTWDDVEQVPVAGFDQQDQAFVEGRLDAIAALIGSVVELNSQVPVQHISLDDSPEAVARMQEWVPGSYITVVEPKEGRVGVFAPINAMTQDWILFANEKVSDDIVYEVVKAIYNNPDELKAATPLFERFDPKGLAKDVGEEYHPGALKFYKEMGIR